MKQVLYISSTGMTEPLGQSQVLEYLMELSKNFNINLISYEREKDSSNIKHIKNLTIKNNIQWFNLKYSNKYGVFSSIQQIVYGIMTARSIIKNEKIYLIHARSFIPGIIGLLLKYTMNVRLLYDIRGFTTDEMVDRNRISKKSLMYKILKKIDDLIYKKSDHLVTLTHKSKEIMFSKYNYFSDDDITVIPTCANNKIFKKLNERDIKLFKSKLGYTQEDIIFIHTGTVSGWYDFEKELMVIEKLMIEDKRIHFLILNKHEKYFIDQLVKKYDLDLDRVKLMSAKFEDVHKYLSIASYSIFFIKPTFSKQASAPTKFAENIACMLPSITNKNVGDMEFYLDKYDVGLLVDLDRFNLEEIVINIVNDIDRRYEDKVFNKLFNNHLDKQKAVKLYSRIYMDMENI